MWVKSLNNEKGTTVLNAFVEILNESNRKPNKIWVDQEREFYNKLMQERLENNILMHFTHNEGKSVTAERSNIKISKYKIYKKMTANGSTSSYLNKLVDQYNNLLSLC